MQLEANAADRPEQRAQGCSLTDNFSPTRPRFFNCCVVDKDRDARYDQVEDDDQVATDGIISKRWQGSRGAAPVRRTSFRSKMEAV